MSNIILFRPKKVNTQHDNLSDFIELCKKQLTVFGSDLNWSSNKWSGIANFTKIGIHSRKKEHNIYFSDEFLDFSKAYLRYQQGHKPTQTKNELKALRCIEKALIQQTGTAYITDVSTAILDEATVIARQYYSKGAAYHAGRELERLSHFLSTNNIVNTITQWKSPIKRAKDLIQTGKKATERRNKKLPAIEVLNAIAEIFANEPYTPRDIFTSSVFAMLLCAPSRISEILLLPTDCEVETPDKDNNLQYGWRFYSGKGFGSNIKWIPKEMVPIAKEAIKQIKVLTKPARDLASWLETNPNRFYRHKDCPVKNYNEKLTTIEAAKALGLKHDSTHSSQGSLSSIKLQPYNYIYSLNDLWNSYIIKKQPNNFPWLNKEQKLKYRNALFCMTKNLLHKQKGNLPIVLWGPTNNIFNNDLSPRESLNSDNHKSIFDRYNYLDQEGERLKVTSHQLRHLLNTIAEKGGLSQHEIARWAGRADPKQNRVYNHMTEHEMVVQIKEIDSSLSLFGPMAIFDKNNPVSMEEFHLLEKGCAHVTEYGFCVHDYTIAPCDKYRDCLNCTELVCIKGDDVKLENIKHQLEEITAQHDAAKISIEEGSYGADRWFEYHQHTIKHLQQLIKILEDPNVPDKARIKLNNDSSYSQLNRVIRSLTGTNKVLKESVD